MMEAMPTAIFSMKAKTALSVVGAFSGSLIGMFDSFKSLAFGLESREGAILSALTLSLAGLRFV